MNFTIPLVRRINGQIFKFHFIVRSVCSGNVKDNGGNNGYEEKLDFDSTVEWKPVVEGTFLGVSSEVSDDDEENDSRKYFSPRQRFFEDARLSVDIIFETLLQDGPGFDTKLALNELRLKISNYLVREVLLRILKSITYSNQCRCAKLGYKFFVWSGEQENYTHTSNTYNLMMKIFADCNEFRAMWIMLDEMTDKHLSITGRTFNILLSTCGEAVMMRKMVERFIQLKTFDFRPFKHSFNAILHSLIVLNQYRLIEWVYQQMILENHSPDILTFNVLMYAKFRLGKVDEVYRLLDEIGRKGISPDMHTYNIFLHILGTRDKPLGALNFMNRMREVGCEPSVVHFTSLIHGLSRAGNLEACKHFFDEMVKKGCMPDVVCYTVMITGYVVSRDLEKAQAMFDEMIVKGQLPNVFTYNAMIRGLCVAKKFEEARSILNEMESRGCNPNFVVYSTLVENLRKARRFSEAHEIMGEMVEKGLYHYVDLLSKFNYRRR
ncbi:Pentatricopeptide repeat-containing protein [Thalictrum thalictroides]|uniref:Pentatricopeptide repeat-containing protein n=1 Tax=Thalictrum thalictroides TaxID=46969 RepID=A0A7J6WBI8_THATH|nr:Pentatricopeptide repeat-containing protein [Thalictrum thalictroides]